MVNESKLSNNNGINEDQFQKFDLNGDDKDALSKTAVIEPFKNRIDAQDKYSGLRSPNSKFNHKKKS